MLQRCTTAFIAIPTIIVIWLISPFWYEIPTFLLAFSVGLIINSEIMIMAKKMPELHYPSIFISISMTISLLLNYLYSMHIIDLSFLFICEYCLLITMFYFFIGKELLSAHNYSKNMENFGFIILNYITLVIFYPLLLVVKTIVVHSWAIIFLFTFCWINDAFGLLSGKLFGRRPLKNLPSRSKTLEGYIGSIILTILLGIICFYIQGFLQLPFHWSLFKWSSFGLSISLSSNIGDLTESLIKRYTHQKDSGSSLPGIGGFFDAIDSQIYSLPIILLYFS